MIELVDYNENLLKEKEAKKEGRTRRSRRGGQKAAAAVEAPATVEAEKELPAAAAWKQA